MVSTSLSQPEFTIFFKNIGEIFFFGMPLVII